jgi:TonB family protein
VSSVQTGIVRTHSLLLFLMLLATASMAQAGIGNSDGAVLLGQERTCPAEVADHPTRTPMSVPPIPVDREETREAFAEGLARISESPPLKVQVSLWLLIGKTGRIEDARISAGSGNSDVDSLAVALARGIRFRPATLQGQATCVWMRLRAPFPPSRSHSGPE